MFEVLWMGERCVVEIFRFCSVGFVVERGFGDCFVVICIFFF